MKIIKAKFKNFRLLRDVKMEFSTDENKKLTVIRADNGTGKTTAMGGLIWCLYGSKVFKDKIYPLSLFEDGIRSIDVEVEIEFENEDPIVVQGKTIYENKHYVLRRKCTEVVSDDGQSSVRNNEDVSLYEITSSGCRPLQSELDVIIDRTLPMHLKDIYFTDGDKALTFIESTASEAEKRTRVRKAIESLLSMKELEGIIRNLKSIRSAYIGKMDNSDYGAILKEKSDKYSDNEAWIDGAEKDTTDLLKQKLDADDSIISLRNRIEEQLTLGNKEALNKEIKSLRETVTRFQVIKDSTLESLCSLISSQKLSTSIIADKINVAINILHEMNARDTFPKQFAPVLNDVLKYGTCICGDNLDEVNAQGATKRDKIKDIIHKCRETDELNSRASNLYFASDKYTIANSGWSNEYDKLTRDYFNADKSIRETTINLKQKDDIVKEIKDDLLIMLREQLKVSEKKSKDLDREITINRDEIDRAREKNILLKREIDTALLKIGKKNDVGGKRYLTDIVLSVYENVFSKIKTIELKKVSKEMNDIFMSMIGADEALNPKGMIRRSELTDEFDIRVYGPNDQPLNPDTELNGASRRAISLSFILALTKVSNVIAPNIIDTPLGMTSGHVKSSILKNLVTQGSQIILFLTYDEIKGVEELLDRYSGKSMTLTFSGHYPRMLKNKPIQDGETRVCSCNHRESCDICERIDQSNMKRRG